MPVKSNAKCISRYVGKYISKHISQRLPEDKGARVVRFIGYKPGMRRTCCRFSWNTTNGWLWRHKTKAFAQRFGLTDYTQMRIHFGSRWAYRLQGQILSERLEGTVFPSRMAAERNLNQMFPMLVAQDKAKDFIEQLPVTQTRLLSNHKYDCGAPVWAVPEWFGEKIQKIPMTPEVIQEADENSHKLRLYAKQLPDMPEPLSRSTYKSRIEFSANEN